MTKFHPNNPSNYDSRKVAIEVTGLRGQDIKRTIETLIVPYYRLSQTIQNIHRRGGQILKITMYSSNLSDSATTTPSDSVITPTETKQPQTTVPEISKIAEIVEVEKVEAPESVTEESVNLTETVTAELIPVVPASIPEVITADTVESTSSEQPISLSIPKEEKVSSPLKIERPKSRLTKKNKRNSKAKKREKIEQKKVRRKSKIYLLG
jgi:hypothetical protein